MAKVSAEVREKVFQIKKWLGVNEAPEGDTRLKNGEASEMRNFRITAGGALRKRPGSMNVAGLMSEYTVTAETGTEETPITMFGVPGPVDMYPRAETDSVGTPIGGGEAVSVSPEDAEDYAGHYIENGGALWKFLRTESTAGTGDIAVTGGKLTAGSLAKITTGQETNYSGTVTATGTQEIVTSAAVEITGENTAGLNGEETVRERALSSEAGWKTQDAGGWVIKDGTLWKYYGAKTESYTSKHRWKRYACEKNSSIYYFYTEGTWSAERTVYLSSVTGSTSYVLNTNTGVFSDSGGTQTIGWDIGGNNLTSNLGSVYVNSGSTQTRYSYSGGQSMSYATRSAVLTSGGSISYEIGDYMFSELVTDGSRPAGTTYETTVTQDGVSYAIVTDGTNYYALTEDEKDETDYYSCVWAWYGYPVEISADRLDWVCNPTVSANNDADSVVRGIWSGFVAGSEVLCAACNGFLWELDLTDGKWSKTACGVLNTARDVFMFGFDEKLYLLNGTEYKVWDGETLSEVNGYRPLVLTAAAPGGGGTTLESVNKLTGQRRGRYSPDGTATVFTLPETGLSSIDYVTDLVTGNAMTGWTADTEAGTVTFEAAPKQGINTLEIGWTHPQNDSAAVKAMRWAELYNGTQDSRVFLYGDGSNKCIYSGLDSNGQPRADYFPDLNVAAVGDGNTPITAMIRHYGKLLAFKQDSAYSIAYDTLTLASGETAAGFYITPVNRSIGSCAPGQAVLVENRPRTLDGRSIIEWKATSTSGNLTSDQRNAQRISQRVDRTIRQFDLSTAKTFYDKYAHEYYVTGPEGTTLVNSVDADAWFVYTGFDARCFINYKDELYIGTGDGYLRHVSEEYFSDNGKAIDAHWESGSMPFNADYRRKYSAMLWIGIKPEENGYLKVTAETDRKSDFAEYVFSTGDSAGVPTMERLKLKAKKFTFYKMILTNNTADTTATVVSADIRVRETGYVR